MKIYDNDKKLRYFGELRMFLESDLTFLGAAKAKEVGHLAQAKMVELLNSIEFPETKPGRD